MKFPYYKIGPDLSRPIIEFIVSCGDKKAQYFGLVDSGSDTSLFHSDVADVLGIDLESGIKRKISGIVQGESQDYYVHPVTLKVGGWEYTTTVGFMPTLSRNGYGLLGQNDFFALFKRVSFDFNKKEIEFVQKSQ